MFKLIKDACRRLLQREPPTLGKEVADGCRRRVQQENPKLDEAAVDEIVKNVQCVYQLIPDACRRRLQQQRPNLDKAALDDIVTWTPFPPILLVERALVQRMQLPEEERTQQVAELMVLKHLLPD